MDLQQRWSRRLYKYEPHKDERHLDDSLTLRLRQGGEEGLEAGGQPLHALVQVGQSLQVADVTQDLVLGDQLVAQVPGQHLRLLGESHPGRGKKRNKGEGNIDGGELLHWQTKRGRRSWMTER